MPCAQAVGGRLCRVPCAVHIRPGGCRGRGRLSPAPPPPWRHSAPAETFVPTSQQGAGLCHSRHPGPGTELPRSPWPCPALTTAPLPAQRQSLAPGVAVAEHGARGCRPSLCPSLCPSVCPQEVIQQQEEVSCRCCAERCRVLWGCSLGGQWPPSGSPRAMALAATPVFSPLPRGTPECWCRRAAVVALVQCHGDAVSQWVL